LLIDFEYEKFTFVDFVVDPQANLLIKKGREKRIESKAMSLLILLASDAGKVITRKQLLTSIWPNVVVGDEVISQLVYSLRNALGDDAKNPQYIETIPKKGYRFIAEVKGVESTKNILQPAEKIIALRDKKPQSKVNTKLLLSGCLLLMLALVIIWSTGRGVLQSNDINFVIENVLPVTQETGVEGDFAFHKNHNKMVYVSATEEGVDLFLKALGTSHSQRLTDDTWKEYSPLWLDAQTLLYIRWQLGQHQIIRHRLQQEAEILYQSTNRISNLAINSATPNELTFIEYDYYRHNRLTELKVLNLLDNKAYYLHDSLLNLPSEIHHPIYSLDGKILFFFDNTDKIQQIVSLNINSNQYTTITNRFTSVAHISLIDRDHLLVSAQLAATKGVWKLSLNDNTITSIFPSTGGQKVVRAALKDGQLYYATHKTSRNLMIANINTKTIDRLENLNSGANESSGIFSKDNQTIYFVSNRTGYYELWKYDDKDKQATIISKINADFIYRPLLSHDENYLAVVYQKEKLTLAIISVATGLPISQTSIPSIKFPLAWSRDDKSLYISEHKGQVNIYQYGRDTLQPSLIQQRAGLFAQESNDGKTLTLFDYNVGGLINRDMINNDIKQFNNAISNLSYLAPGQLKVIGSSIFTVKHDGPLRQLQKYPLMNTADNDEGTLLMKLPNGSSVTDFNTKGTQAIFTSSTSPHGDIMKIVLSQ